MESESNVCTTSESKDVDVVLGELLREAEAVLEAETNETAVEPALLDNAAADGSIASDELPIESLPIADLPPELLPFITVLSPQQKYFDFPESGDFFLKSTRPPNSNEISDLCISVPLSRLQLLALTTPDSSFIRIFNTFATPSAVKLPKPQTAVEKKASKPEETKAGPSVDAKSVPKSAQIKTKTSPPISAAEIKTVASALTSRSSVVSTSKGAVDHPDSLMAAVVHPDIRTSSAKGGSLSAQLSSNKVEPVQSITNYGRAVTKAAIREPPPILQQPLNQWKPEEPIVASHLPFPAGRMPSNVELQGSVIAVLESSGVAWTDLNGSADLVSLIDQVKETFKLSVSDQDIMKAIVSILEVERKQPHPSWATEHVVSLLTVARNELKNMQLSSCHKEEDAKLLSIASAMGSAPEAAAMATQPSPDMLNDDDSEKGRNLPPDLFQQLKQFSKPFVSRRCGPHVRTYDDLPVDERSLAAAKEMIQRWQRKNSADPAANAPDLLSEGLTCFRRLWTFNIHRFLDKRRRLQEKFAGGREPFRREVIPPEEELREEQHVESIEDAEEDQRGRKLPPDLFQDLKEYSRPLVDRRFGPHVKAYQDLPIDQRSLAGAQEIIERWQVENSSEPAANASDFLDDSLAGFQRVWNMAINRLLSKRRNWQEKFGGRPETFRPEGGGRGRGGIPRPSYRGREREDFVRQPDRSTFEYSSPLAHTTHYPSINRYYPTAGAFPPPKAPGGRFSDLSDDEEDQQKSDLKYSRNWESEGPGSIGYYSRSDERPAKRSAPYERESWQGPRDYDSKRPRDFSPERYSDQGTVMRPRLDDINLSQFFSSPGDADLLKEMLHALKPNSSAGIDLLGMFNTK